MHAVLLKLFLKSPYHLKKRLRTLSQEELVNDELNAIVLKTYDDQQTEKLVNQGAFYGVPTFLKDTDNIKGYNKWVLVYGESWPKE